MGAMEAARKAVEKMYDSNCVVTEYQSVKDPKTKRITQKEVVALENQPCRVSFKSIPASKESDVAAAMSQTIRLFTAPEPNIKPGSKITVSKGGRIAEYKSSGVPAVYNTHQEIELELFKGWA